MSLPADERCQPLRGAALDEVMSSTDNFLFDCDGVLWRGNRALDGAPAAVNALKRLGKRVFFVTNNSRRTRAMHREKLRRLGFRAARRDVYGSAFLAAQFLRLEAPPHGRVYVIGDAAVCRELSDAGISYVEAGPEPAFGDVEQWTNLPLEPDVGAVLVAFDEHFSYMKLIKACCYLARPGCLFLATNRDHAELVAPGRVLPVTGSLLAAVETGAARQATVLGKPSPFILRCIAATSPGGALDPARTLIVGDRLDMDVAFGNACGLRSVLALSGVSSLEDARGCLAEPARRHHVPDFYIESVADLLGAAQIRANPGAGSEEGEDDDSDGGV
ncbi:glycerol-3-phosphate phosphatase-like [Lethenteron reissneri]|uniref:glycerol-3-phosphate phosphatase-like n=1 Tax=Lethenteron reissneri TaxID=7753 RepID=UPI002AB6EC47|nr:glycerol-3-phosphate phosphatase-like [Lethenteron reissneri]XP_061404986.1 glycerol-3-phosphate phosphatase-like [Lethenteron reissneri]XP_061404987.1 glycerol-3-phosphate phosphatase-like [Lethenteron reissneri]XP_061404988.1 glycerol-3-phosphate phosphatase-like [Lethenteron reissneri]XP_061404989.1 glycerol-3-phosphate phosphatase-like [Lethenteron reissneri]